MLFTAKFISIKVVYSLQEGMQQPHELENNFHEFRFVQIMIQFFVRRDCKAGLFCFEGIYWMYN